MRFTDKSLRDLVTEWMQALREAASGFCPGLIISSPHLQWLPEVCDPCSDGSVSLLHLITQDFVDKLGRTTFLREKSKFCPPTYYNFKSAFQKFFWNIVQITKPKKHPKQKCFHIVSHSHHASHLSYHFWTSTPCKLAVLFDETWRGFISGFSASTLLTF